MWSLAKGYMERRNMYMVGYYCSCKYLKSIKMVILKCSNERKQSETSFFYSLDMLWRYWRHVAMQANHWRHPHFRWRYVLSLDALLMIIMLQMCLKTRFIVKDYKTLWNIDFFFVSMMTSLLSHRTIFSRLFHLLCIPFDFQEKHNHFHDNDR